MILDGLLFEPSLGENPRNRNLSKKTLIHTETIPNVVAAEKSPRQAGERFRHLLAAGYRLRADGLASDDPHVLLRTGYTPKYEIELFGTRFFVCNQRDVEGMKVLPAYVLPATGPRRQRWSIYARVFYKDSSLVWRAGSHYIDASDYQWIGKGAVKWVNKRGERGWFSAEETTNLPFEMQAALDDVSHRGPRSRTDHRILNLVLRQAPANRVRPYQDFEGPRKSAMSLRANRINNNRPVAWFADDSDPGSLHFAPGFEPSFKSIIDISTSRSTMYGGVIRKHRIVSRNGRIQYMFVSGPHHVWLVHAQAFTTELSSYGLRTVDVIADDDLFIPGYEFFDNTGDGEIDDQIPPGFAGPVCPLDPDRADASPWNDRLPVVQAFRRSVLNQSR